MKFSHGKGAGGAGTAPDDAVPSFVVCGVGPHLASGTRKPPIGSPPWDTVRCGTTALCERLLRAAGGHDTLRFMSDTRALISAIVGTGLAVITIVVTVLSMQIAGVNTRIDDIRDLRADHVRFEERLDSVEVAVGKVEQRLDTLERVLLPSREPVEE